MPIFSRNFFQFIICLVMAIILPWHKYYSALPVIALGVLYFLDSRIIEKLKIVFIDKRFYLYLIIFIVYSIGLYYTTNTAEGALVWERKLGFLLLPLVFISDYLLKPSQVKIILQSFCISLIAAGIFCFLNGWYNYYHWQQPGYHLFLYENLAIGIMHPGYFSNFYFLGWVLLTLPFFYSKYDFLFTKKIQIALCLFYFLMIALLTSKTVYLAFGFYTLVMAIKLMLNSKALKNRIAVLGGLIIMVFVAYLVLFKFLNGRLNFAELKITEPSKVLFQQSMISRFAAAQVGLQAANKKALFGYGTGMSNDVLLKNLEAKGYTNLVSFHMHTHNQFIKTYLDLGLFGLIPLIIWLLYLLVTANKTKNNLLFWFAILIVINCATDDMLDIQAGVVYFLFFSCIFLFAPFKVLQTKQLTAL